MEQRQWIARALEGDRSARAHLFEENISPIYYLCWKLTGSAAQAGDLTRRTFDRAFSSLAELRPDASFDRWVTAIAVNLCRQTMKKAQPWLFTTDEREMAILRDTYVAEEECLPPGCIEDPEQRSLALRTVSLLPPEQRVCLVLRYAAHLKPHQIAKTMDVDEVTILGRLNSARRALMTTLPSPEPQALISALFAQESAALPVPELLRGSCMQTVLSAQPELPAEPELEPEQDEPASAGTGLFGNMTKKQKIFLWSGIGLALVLVILILALALRGCSPQEPEPLPELPPAPVEEVDENLEAAAILEEYGVEVLLTYSRREAEELIESWQDVLSDYVSGGNPDDLGLTLQSSNDAVSEVRLRLENADLDITRLRGLDLGTEPELAAAKTAIASQSGFFCYTHPPLFDPEPRAQDSMAVYSENYRYELLDDNGDGRAEALSITRTGAGYDPERGIFHPYGDSLSALLGLRRADAEALFGPGHYEGDDVDVFTMALTGGAADDSELTVAAVMQARSDMDAAHQYVSAITLQADGCFAELLPELQLPDSSLTLNQLNRKLQAMKGHLGLLEGDVFAPLVLEGNQSYLIYYTGATRYCFCADTDDTQIRQVEVLDLADCRLWDSANLRFRLDGFDLEKLLGLDRYAAYANYGIRSYPTPDFSGSALGLWEANGAIRTVYNARDPRVVWGLKLGDSRDTIEEKITTAGGYCCQAGDTEARYVLPEKRELAVTYRENAAKILQLEDHSYQSDYKAPEPLRKSPQELFGKFLETLGDVKTSWFGDLTHDGTGDLLVCRPSSTGCLVQLYVVKDDAVNETPIYSQSLTASAATDLYVVTHDSGPCLLAYTLSENTATRRCSWKLMSINAAGGEVVLGQNEATVNLLELLLGSQEAYDAVKQEADGYRAEGSFLCGTQSGNASFSDQKANLDE